MRKGVAAFSHSSFTVGFTFDSFKERWKGKYNEEDIIKGDLSKAEQNNDQKLTPEQLQIEAEKITACLERQGTYKHNLAKFRDFFEKYPEDAVKTFKED